jgi:hypothetical protein
MAAKEEDKQPCQGKAEPPTTNCTGGIVRFTEYPTRGTSCPNCGYCPHCGRSNPTWTPYNPNLPYNGGVWCNTTTGPTC